MFEKYKNLDNQQPRHFKNVQGSETSVQGEVRFVLCEVHMYYITWSLRLTALLVFGLEARSLI